MLRNFNDKANSIKPRKIFTVLSQLPELGRLFNHCGKIAKAVKVRANAMENPNIPSTGISMCPEAEAISILPTNGPVQENDTKTKVSAIKKIPNRPPDEDFLSTLVTRLLGKLISKRPRNHKAKKTNIIKNTILGSQWVAIQLANSGPPIKDTSVPNKVNITMMHIPKKRALKMPFFLLALSFVKNVTVIGIMGYTQGVNSASTPARNAPSTKVNKE
jgi:hypothetical protein